MRAAVSDYNNTSRGGAVIPPSRFLSMDTKNSSNRSGGSMEMPARDRASCSSLRSILPLPSKSTDLKMRQSSRSAPAKNRLNSEYWIKPADHETPNEAGGFGWTEPSWEVSTAVRRSCIR